MAQTTQRRAGDVVPRIYRSRRRSAPLIRLAILVAVVVLVVAHLAHSGRDYLSTDGWPTIGQGAYQMSGAQPAASPEQHPVPIASLAKVMTAYLVLQAHPLPPGAGGFELTVSPGDVADTARRERQGQSLVPVSAGEVLTERQALMALLLPSANNVAIMLAEAVAGSVPIFVHEMNQAAQRLGMRHTTYTDPSGYSVSTVSTAADQLLLAERVADNPTLAAMMATPSYPLPIAGTVYNTDTLLGSDGFVGMKTGSDSAAGGCFMFHVDRHQNGRTLDLVGVVLGQRGRNLIDSGLYAAQQLTDRLARR